MNRLNNFNGIFIIIAYVLFLVGMIIAISSKCNYHSDEIVNYALANENGSWDFRIQDGKQYIPSETPFLNHVIVQPEHRFDYPNVWKNQSTDTHPPFYYALLHTICSFFPKTFSPWLAGCINIFFALLTLLVLRKLSFYFLKDILLINIVAVAFVLSAGILSSTTFLRMYTTAMFWTTLLLYYYVREINEDKGDQRKFLLKVSVATLMGAMTHYYCIVYAGLISIVYFIYLWLGKRYKEICVFSSYLVMTGVISCLIFPAMIHHIFSGYRGNEVLSNAANFSDFFDRCYLFCQIIDRQLFGNYGFLLLWGILLLTIELVIQYKKNKSHLNYDSIYNNKLIIGYTFLLIPAFLYFAVIAKVTPYLSDRYMFPIYAISFWSVLLLLQTLFNRLLSSKSAVLITILVLCVITAGSWMNADWPYLYRETKPLLHNASKYSSNDCICVYTDRWRLGVMWVEVKNYNSIRFVDIRNKKMIEKLVEEVKYGNADKFILSLTGIPLSEHKKYIELFWDNTAINNSYQTLGSYFWSTSYIVYKNK